jgi:uracil-DNA glycosylase family 4
VVGEAPGPSGWWRTGKAFHTKNSGGECVLSRTGKNLQECLDVVRLRLDDVFYVEAVKCRPRSSDPWRPTERVRIPCKVFLDQQLAAVEPSLVLALGVTATLSCVEVAAGSTMRPRPLSRVVGRIFAWDAPWGECIIVPLYHPSSANNPRAAANKRLLMRVAHYLVMPEQMRDS